MLQSLDLVGIGGLSYDIVLQIERLPASDAKLPAHLLGVLPGGFIANATCAAARLGLNVGYVGWVGDDAQGAMLREDFGRYGVDIGGLVAVAGEPTPFTVIMVVGDERVIVVPKSPLYDLTPDAQQMALARRAKIVLTYPRDADWCRRMADAAHEGGGLLALDVETLPASAETVAALGLADVIFLAGDVVGDDMERARALSVGRWVIVTAGRAGAYGFVDGAGPMHQPAFRVDVADTTGAGDCFHAALLASRLWGNAMPAALRFAAAAAAIKVQSVGARGGLPTRAQVDRFIGENEGNT